MTVMLLRLFQCYSRLSAAGWCRLWRRVTTRGGSKQPPIAKTAKAAMAQPGRTFHMTPRICHAPARIATAPSSRRRKTARGGRTANRPNRIGSRKPRFDREIPTFERTVSVTPSARRTPAIARPAIESAPPVLRGDIGSTAVGTGRIIDLVVDPILGAGLRFDHAFGGPTAWHTRCRRACPHLTSSRPCGAAPTRPRLPTRSVVRGASAPTVDDLFATQREQCDRHPQLVR